MTYSHIRDTIILKQRRQIYEKNNQSVSPDPCDGIAVVIVVAFTLFKNLELRLVQKQQL